MSKARPPLIAEKILSAMLPERDRQSVLGDFNELFDEKVNQAGFIAARRAYWLEVISSSPHLLFEHFRKQKTWRQTMTGSQIFQSGRRIALWGLILLIPSMLIAIPGIIFSLTGEGTVFDNLQNSFSLWSLLIHPMVVLGGLSLAILINLFAVVRFRIDSEEDEVVSTISLKKSSWNIVLLLLGGFFATVIFIYLLAENLQFFTLF